MSTLRSSAGHAILCSICFVSPLTSQQGIHDLTLTSELVLLPKALKLPFFETLALLRNGQILVGKSMPPVAVMMDSAGSVAYRIEPPAEARGGIVDVGLVGDTIWLAGPKGSGGAVFIAPGGRQTRDEQGPGLRFRESRSFQGMGFQSIEQGFPLVNGQLIGLGVTRTTAPIGVPPAPGPYMVVTGRLGGIPTKAIVTLPNRCERVGSDPWVIERILTCQPPQFTLSTDATRMIFGISRLTPLEESGVEISALTLTGDTIYSKFVPVTGIPAAAGPRTEASARPLILELKGFLDGSVAIKLAVPAGPRWLIMTPDGRVRGWLPTSALSVARGDRLGGVDGDAVWIVEEPGEKKSRLVRYRITD